MTSPASPGSPRVAFVTGCSSGFGLLSAVTLARRGFRVFASMRDLARRAALDAAAARAGVALEVVPYDVTDTRAAPEVVARVAQAAGAPVEVLVNNAGTGVIGALEDTTMEEIREVFETNFFGAAALARAVIPAMRARGRGRIINVSSVGGRLGTANIPAYCASKFALEGLSEALRLELRPFGVHVVEIEPGMFGTTMTGPSRRVARAAQDPASAYRRMTEFIQSTMQRTHDEPGGADPQRVADVIAHAATTAAPALRYAVGNDARALLTLQKVLPERGFEWANTKLFETIMARMGGAAG